MDVAALLLLLLALFLLAWGVSYILSMGNHPGSSRSSPSGGAFSRHAPTRVVHPGGRESVLIFLHGLGDSGAGWEEGVEGMAPPSCRVLLPSAASIPVTLNGGMTMPAWYDILGMRPGGPEDDAGIDRVCLAVAKLVEAELHAGVPANRIFLGGFSQGGAVALRTALGGYLSQHIGGVVCLSSYLPGLGSFRLRAPNTPVFMGHGTNDPMVPSAFGDLTVGRLQQQGYDSTGLESKRYPGLGHGACPAELGDVRRWIEEHMEEEEGGGREA